MATQENNTLFGTYIISTPQYHANPLSQSQPNFLAHLLVFAPRTGKILAGKIPADIVYEVRCNSIVVEGL